MVFQRLTDRQADVLWMVCDGYAPAEIAQSLQITRVTVERYQLEIRRRLDFAPFDDICLDVEAETAAVSSPFGARLRIAS